MEQPASENYWIGGQKHSGLWWWKNKDADERCCVRLEGYCEWNQKLQALDEAETIPLNVWPYVYHLASLGGADLLYQYLCENLGYMLSDWHCQPKNAREV